MNRTEKNAAIEKMAGALRGAPHVIVTDFRGLTVNQSTDLRRRIRQAGGSFRVVKNRLARRAAVGTAAENVSTHLAGPRAVAFHGSDPVALAKVLTEFAKDNPQLGLVAGVVDAREVVGVEQLKALAALPGLPGLRAQVLAVLEAPAARLLRLVATPSAQLVRALDARREKLEAGGV